MFDEEQITHSSRIYDRYSNEIEVLGQETSPVAYADIPEVLVDALLSVEDSEFFYHNGFNPKRILTSFVSNLFSNSVQGGSTLTQQLIKNTALSGEKTYSRKVKEAYLSFLLEKEYSKEEILELYFNKIYFEQSVPGIQYACRVFFNKSVGQINLVEAALLAGLVKSPSYYYPFSYPERCTERKNIVLKSMLDNRVIDEAQYRFASAVRVEDILYTKDDPDLSVYPYQAYLDLVYEEVRQLTGKRPLYPPADRGNLPRFFASKAHRSDSAGQYHRLYRRQSADRRSRSEQRRNGSHRRHRRTELRRKKGFQPRFSPETESRQHDQAGSFLRVGNGISGFTPAFDRQRRGLRLFGNEYGSP